MGPTRQNPFAAHTIFLAGHYAAAGSPAVARSSHRIAQRVGCGATRRASTSGVVLNQTFALLLSYDGAAFRGWQKQPGMATVQGTLEGGLRALLGKRPVVHGASRTDAGVHALGQVASLKSGRATNLDGLQLPPALRLLRWTIAERSFHARSSAIGKRYRYALRSFVQGEPDWERARAALRGLAGLPHLSGLCSPSRGHKPAPPLTSWSLGDDGVLEVTGRAFRKHEVRNLAGHLAAIALGFATPDSLADLARRTRPWMGVCAPAQGLTLLEVLYPPDLDPFR